MLDFLKEDMPKSWHSLCDSVTGLLSRYLAPGFSDSEVNGGRDDGGRSLELGLARFAIKCIMHYLLPTSDGVS
jgi:hypothetical protein